MFRTYRRIESPIQLLQQHVEAIVTVWCNAEGDFDITLFDDAHLIELIETIEINNRVWKDEIEIIFNLFKVLSASERTEIRAHFDTNNQIERLCRGELHPVKYDDLPETLRRPLKVFFNDLYEKVLNRKPFTDKYETMKAYFNRLTKVSRFTICPFCALSSLTPQYEDGRDAFDHCLPKSIYPFTSVNLLNLVPICHICNSGYKSSKDPLFHNSIRIQTIFPFGIIQISEYAIQIRLNNRLDIVSTITPDDMTIDFGNEQFAENWDRIFGIKVRYKAKIAQEMRQWYRKLHNDFRKNPSSNINNFIEDRLFAYYDRPLEEKNFLKYAIFTALNEGGFLAQSLEESVTTS